MTTAGDDAGPPRVSIDDLIERYHTLLLDAYGVLLDKAGPLPGAVALIERLNREGKPYLILTNSASRLPESMARDFAALGLPIASERIPTSGMLVGPYLAKNGLVGKHCLVMIGDQLATDILGARGYDLDAALVEAGLAPPTPGRPEMAPTFVLSGLGYGDER